MFEGDATHLQRDRNAIKNTGKQTVGKDNQSKSWSMSEPAILGKSKENQRESKSWRNWDRSILLTDCGFTRNGALTKGAMVGGLTVE